MIRWIVNSSLQFRFLVIVLATVLMVYGVTELRAAPVDIYPEFNPPLVEIQTEALGLSAAEMEALITVPLEADLLNGVAWLDQIYSESVTGLSSILLVFEPGTDPIEARQMVQERLTQTFALPNVSSPPTMLQPLSTSNRVMLVGLSSQDLSLIEMSVLARWNIKPRLMGVPGVANVAIWGQREWQLQVQVDPERLHDQDITLGQIIKTTGEALWVSPLSYLEASTPGTAGWIDTPNQRLGIRHQLPISSPEGLAQVPVVGTDGLLLGDVTDIVEDHQPLIGDAVLDDGPGLLLVIEKFPGANVLEVTRGVDEALEDMRPGLRGLEIDTTVFRPATYIEKSIDNLSLYLLIGAALVAIALSLLFFEWRAVVICLVVIPLSLLTAAFVLYQRDVPFNMMVLAGLAVGLAVIVDDVILDVDHIARRLRENHAPGTDQSKLSIVLEASVESRSPLMFAILIILLAVLPIFFLDGLSGSFFEPLGLTYVLAVLSSLAIALIFTPALSLILYATAPPRRRESPLARMLQRAYSALLPVMLKAPGRAFLLVIVISLIGAAALPFFEQALVPSLKQRDLLIEVHAAPGTSRSEMDRVLALVSEELLDIPGVRTASFHVGRAVTGDRVIEISSGEIWLSLESSANYDTTVATIRDTVNGYPGLSHQLQTFEPTRLNEALAGADEDLVVRVYGHEFDVLRSQAETVRESILGVEGVDDVQVEAVPNEPQVEIETDLARAERYGLKPGDVRRTAATLLSGLEVGSLYQEQKVFSVVVWGTPDIRDSLTDIGRLLIDTPDGDQVPLRDVADVRIVASPTIIQRDAVSRFIDVNVNVSGRPVAAVADDIDRRLDDITFPLEYHAEVRGDFADRQTSRLRVIGAGIVAVLGIFLLLQAAYESWRLAFVAILTLPMALVGGVIAALLAGGELSLGSLFGFLAILALAVRNGIVLTTTYRNLEQEAGDRLSPELILHGASSRLMPIVTTAIVLGLAFLPIVLAGWRAGLEIVRPMGIVILGGLVTSTLLVLFILPALYSRLQLGPKPAQAPRFLEEPQVQPSHN